ncbi:pilus assembly protein TadG-related protein [Nocardioides alcanivorans]|uniref:pilus assembly protein TadG-related protein n=1 Tax=Nocardioides alcanivorans TaxID=2897352 RepID=UPI001F41BBF9|nr:pilus assembly protein TadG-related protein [Nocardioides alcanivorans]
MTSERGSITPLVIGFATVLVLLVGVVIDASAAYLQRQSLDNLADGAALSGANEVRGSAVFSQGLDGDLAPLATDLARSAVHDYLRDTGALHTHRGLQVAVTVRNRTIVVSLTAPLDLPIKVGDLTSGRVGSRGAAVVQVGR